MGDGVLEANYGPTAAFVGVLQKKLDRLNSTLALVCLCIIGIAMRYRMVSCKTVFVASVDVLA